VHAVITVETLGLQLPSYPTLILLAVVVSLWLGPWWVARLEGIDRVRSLWALVAVGLTVYAGGRLHAVLNHWWMFGDEATSVAPLWSGPIHAGGAIAFLAVFGPLVLRWFRIPIGKFADGFAPTLGIGVAIARMGCFLQGCCFGTVCIWPWGVRFPKESYIYEHHKSLGLLLTDAGATAPIHPLQLYFAGAALLITTVALWHHPRKRYDGQVGLAALLLFSASSALLEFFRADYFPRVYWGPLPQLEWVALLLTAAFLLSLLVAETRHRQSSSVRS
jgi:phosphatidylglycerol:prolipoprotein diacylglycerol transferase